MNSFEKLAGMKTLLVDDSDIVRDTLTTVYTVKNCSINAVSEAEEGLQALKREHFDIIICDFRLPGMNGVEFFEQVIELYPDTIRILISGYGNDEMISRASATGIHAFVAKPFSLFALLERLDPLIDKFCSGKLNTDTRPQKKTAFKTNSNPEPKQIAENSLVCWR